MTLAVELTDAVQLAEPLVPWEPDDDGERVDTALAVWDWLVVAAEAACDALCVCVREAEVVWLGDRVREELRDWVGEPVGDRERVAVDERDVVCVGDGAQPRFTA